VITHTGGKGHSWRATREKSAAADYEHPPRGSNFGYDPQDMEALDRVIASGSRTPRAKLEKRQKDKEI